MNPRSLFCRSFAISMAAAMACRKPPPAEIVFAPSRAAEDGSSAAMGADRPSRPAPAASSAGGAPPTPAPSGSGGGGGEVTPAEPALDQCAGFDFAPRPFTKAALISAAGDCALKHYCEFDAEAGSLVARAEEYRVQPSEDRQVTLRGAFLTTAASWQRAEAFRFGPAARSAELGGRDLRDLLYSWPLRAECKVDEQLVSQLYATETFRGLDFQLSPVTGRTLSALEYLLYVRGPSNACTAFSPINANGDWAALSSAEIQTRRAEYAAAVTRDIEARSRDLLAAWSGGFRAELMSVGAPGRLFSNEQAALNAISDALFYVELEVKDQKLGRPLGLTPDCPNDVCPADVESPHAHTSADNLRQNLLGFSRLFEGCGEQNAGIGFDDWLRDAGASDLADRMLAALSNARQVVDGLGRPLEELLVSEPDRVLAAHGAIKALTDLLKTEFVTVLNLELPTATEGDND